MDAILQMIGSAGAPTSFVGLMLLVYFIIRKQEATVRAEQLATIERIRKDLIELDASKDKAEAVGNDLRKKLNAQEIEIVKLQVKLLKAGIDPDED